ncbi:hypothetical protein HSBAA_50310 [Vreelandella sulfidaeris]|uniref:histidine kinase n=1 Tax=Vreelandella sulfidaeris TaxID=115553 RepID=A0A455UCF2_9GAMM|nr:hypothetical protein HSBAA_50310 [Halomonas sulfidaeris]
MGPLRYLRDATQALADGQPHSAVQPTRRDDELGELIARFDGMALKTQGTITAQRQLLADLSHEIRAPLTRLSLAIGQMKATLTHRLNLPAWSRRVSKCVSWSMTP